MVLFQRLDPAHLPTQPSITAITLAELSVGPLVTDDPAERSARQARLQETEASFDPLPFDSAAARAFGRVASELRGSGRKTRARAFDALIAAAAMAMAMANDLPVFTADPADFDGISGLRVVAVPHPDLAPPA